MSISLKNIEDRVKALENKVNSIPTGGGGITECKFDLNGYVVFANGLMFNWGYGKKFAKAFKTKCLRVVATVGTISDGAKNNDDIYVNSTSLTGFTVYRDYYDTYFWAIGYLITYRLLNIYYAHAYKMAHNCLHFLMRFYVLTMGGVSL